MAYRLLSIFVFISATLALITPSLAYNILYSGETLSGGQSLIEGSLYFSMQTDCNLVLYDNNNAVWSSGTNGKAGNCFLSMQRDGNLVIYSGSNPVWASNTGRAGGNYVLVLQRDRNVVIYGSSIWATKSNRKGTAGVTISINSNRTLSCCNR